MISMPDDWVFHREELSKHATYGMDSLKSALKELQKYGYVRIVAERIGGKIVSWSTLVFETPNLAESYTGQGFSPEVDFPQVAKPQVVNPPPTKNDNTKKEKVISNNNADQDDPRFVLFRKEYPGKGGTKKEIAKALNTALKKTTIEEIIKAIQRQKSERATCTPGKFVPAWRYPATWLNKECWTEEPIGSANDTRELSLVQMDEIFR